MSNENENMGNGPGQVPRSDEIKKFWGMEERIYCMLMYLSIFANCIFPFAGVVLPIVMWATNKDQSPAIDRHGKNLLNFLISLSIYGIVLLFFTIFMAFLSALIIGLPIGPFVGFPIFMAMGVAATVLSIIAAIKASNGEYWPYPFCIRFFK